MVNRSVLRKLSDPELEKYLQEGNRFVPEVQNKNCHPGLQNDNIYMTC